MTLLKTNDQVIVLAGSDKGKTGRILAVDRKTDRVVVEGVNLKYKHLRRSQQNPQGGRIQREFPLAVCKVAYLDATTGKGVRLGRNIEGGQKVRVMRPSGKPLEDKKRK